jgi:hypothetical protein
MAGVKAGKKGNILRHSSGSIDCRAKIYTDWISSRAAARLE